MIAHQRSSMNHIHACRETCTWIEPLHYRRTSKYWLNLTTLRNQAEINQNISMSILERRRLKMFISKFISRSENKIKAVEKKKK